MLYNKCVSDDLRKVFIEAIKHCQTKLQPFKSNIDGLSLPSQYEWYSLYMKKTNRKREKLIDTTDDLLEILTNYIEVLEEILL